MIIAVAKINQDDVLIAQKIWLWVEVLDKAISYNSDRLDKEWINVPEGDW